MCGLVGRAVDGAPFGYVVKPTDDGARRPGSQGLSPAFEQHPAQWTIAAETGKEFARSVASIVDAVTNVIEAFRELDEPASAPAESGPHQRLMQVTPQTKPGLAAP